MDVNIFNPCVQSRYCFSDQLETSNQIAGSESSISSNPESAGSRFIEVRDRTVDVLDNGWRMVDSEAELRETQTFRTRWGVVELLPLTDSGLWEFAPLSGGTRRIRDLAGCPQAITGSQPTRVISAAGEQTGETMARRELRGAGMVELPPDHAGGRTTNSFFTGLRTNTGHVSQGHERARHGPHQNSAPNGMVHWRESWS